MVSPRRALLAADPVAPGGSATALQLELVHGDGRPAAAAQVWVVDESCIPKPGERPNRPEAISLVGRLKAIGKFLVADDYGQLQVTVVGNHVGVRAEAGEAGATAAFELTSPRSEVIRVVLAPGDTLRVELYDPAGVPIADAPIVTGQVADGGVIDGSLRCRLGPTDASGRLEWPGWQRMRADVHQLVPNAILGVGAGYCGALRATVIVPDTLRAPLRVVAPRPVRRQIEIRDAGGVVLFWSGQLLTLGEDSATAQGLSVLARDGIAEVLAVPERIYRWQFGGDPSRGQPVVGTGELMLTAAGPLAVTCNEVVGLQGRIASGESMEGITVAYSASWRGPQEVELKIDDDRTFRLQWARGGDRGPLLFRRGQDAVSVAIPPLDGPAADLGTVSIGGRPFGMVRLVDELGQPLLAGVVMVTDAERGGATVRPSEPDTHQVFLLGDEPPREIGLDCSAPGRQRRMVRLTAGQQLAVVLPLVADLEVGVRLATGVPPACVWIRLWQRWGADEGKWCFADEWAPCVAAAAGTDVAVATVRKVEAGRYRARVMSSSPPAVLAEAEVELGSALRPEIEALGARAVRVELSFAPGTAAECYLAAETNVNGWERQPLGLVRTGPGRVDCVVRSDERRMLVIGPHVRGDYFDVAAAAATARVEAWTGPTVPGVDGDLRLVRPRGPAFGPERSCQVWLIQGTSLRREILHGDELMGGWNAWLLPVDYDAVDPQSRPVRIDWIPGTGWCRRF